MQNLQNVRSHFGSNPRLGVHFRNGVFPAFLLATLASCMEDLPKQARESNEDLQKYYTATCSTYLTDYPLGDGTTWVQGRFVKSKIFVMGCTACEKAGSRTSFGRFLICTRTAISTHVLRKHQNSKLHIEALLNDPSGALGAPSEAEFL